MQNFIKQLKAIEKKFMAEVNDSGYTPNKESYSIDICNRYLSMRIECEDEYGDTVIVAQEIEQSGNDITALGIHYDY